MPHLRLVTAWGAVAVVTLHHRWDPGSIGIVGDDVYVCHQWRECDSRKEPISELSFNALRPKRCDNGHRMTCRITSHEWKARWVS